MGEIDNLSRHLTPKDAMMAAVPLLTAGLKPLGREWYRPKQVPLVMFTGVVSREIPDHASDRDDDYGQAFADYIEAHKLGEVVASPTAINWTNNGIRAWIWKPNYEALSIWKALNDPIQVRSL
jgi:hypothetical protein